MSHCKASCVSHVPSRCFGAVATACLALAAVIALAGCHAYEQADQGAISTDPMDVAPTIVEAPPAESAVALSTNGAFSANEVVGTRIYTPYYTVLVPYGYWLEGYSYSYDPTVDANGVGHVLTVRHPASGVNAEAILVYTYAADRGLTAPAGDYALVDLGLSQADSAWGVALAEGYALVGYDAAQADAVAFAPNVAGVDWY